jgi:predicted dehydrogenase
MTIRVGFVGTGFISRTHNWFLKHSTVDHLIVAVSDIDADRGRAFAERVGAVATDVDGVLDAVDVVFVTTWTSEHEPLVAEAARRGVAVFCEKPLGVDAASAQRMVDAVEDAGVASQVGLVLRFIPQFIRTRTLLADERAGRLLAVSFRDDQYLPIQGQYASAWRVDPARAGRGTLLEHSIHDVDVLQWLGGPVETVSGVAREFHGHPRIDDVAVARLEFAGGGVASLTSIWHDITDRPSQRHVEFFCEGLHVRLDGTPEGALGWQFTGEPAQLVQGVELAHSCVDAGLADADDVVEVPGGAMFNPVSPLLRALATGAPPPLPLRSAMPAHRLVDAIYASADADGAPVRVAGGRPGRSA